MLKHANQHALRQELYEQPRFLYVAWNEPASSAPRRWCLLVTTSEQAKYGVVYQVCLSRFLLVLKHVPDLT